MLVHRFRHADLATTQGGARYPTPVTARLNRDNFSAKVLECAPLTLEVADFLELESSPESQHWAARALAYATTFDSPLDRMVGFTLRVPGWRPFYLPFSTGRQVSFGSVWWPAAEQVTCLARSLTTSWRLLTTPGAPFSATIQQFPFRAILEARDENRRLPSANGILYG